MQIDLEDPTTRSVGRWAIASVAATLLLVAVYGVLLVGEWHATGEMGPGSEALVSLARVLPALAGGNVADLLSIVGVVVTAAPLVLAGVCLESAKDGRTPRRLNIFGRVMLCLFLLAAVLSAMAFVWIAPNDWGANHDLGVGGLAHVEAWQRVVLRSSAFSAAALLGIR